MRFNISVLCISTSLSFASAHSQKAHVIRATELSRTSEAEAAEINGKQEECTPYFFAPVGYIIKSYPPIWEIANMSTTGISTADLVLFKSINASIPKIPPKGTPEGDFTGVVYSDSDPDCWWSWSKCTKPKITNIPDDIINCPVPQTWIYSLDDGPNCSHNAYYDYLLEMDQKATLFYIGSNVMDWPLEAQRGLADGHEICAHTWSHRYMTALTNEEVFAELYYSKKSILQVLGVTVTCWRPPFGDVDDRVRFIAQKLGMRTVLWAQDTSDWKVYTVGVAAVEKNYQEIIDDYAKGAFIENGPIVLTHELNNLTMSIAASFLPSIQSTFKGGVMPMTVCLNNTEPYEEQDGKYIYPNAAQWQAGTRSITLLKPTVNPNAVILNDSPAVYSASKIAPLGTLKFQGGSPTSSSLSSPSVNMIASASSNNQSFWKVICILFVASLFNFL